MTLGALRGDGRDGWRMVVANKVGGRGLLSGYLVVTWRIGRMVGGVGASKVGGRGLLGGVRGGGGG